MGRLWAGYGPGMGGTAGHWPVMGRSWAGHGPVMGRSWAVVGRSWAGLKPVTLQDVVDHQRNRYRSDNRKIKEKSCIKKAIKALLNVELRKNKVTTKTNT